MVDCMVDCMLMLYDGLYVGQIVIDVRLESLNRIDSIIFTSLFCDFWFIYHPPCFLIFISTTLYVPLYVFVHIL